MHERDAFVRGTACIFRYIDQINTDLHIYESEIFDQKY